MVKDEVIPAEFQIFVLSNPKQHLPTLERWDKIPFYLHQMSTPS